MIKIATWNVNSLRVRLPHVLNWLTETRPDVIALQEIKLENHLFPEKALAEIGYQAIWSGQKTYNGVAVLSRFPMQDAEVILPTLEDEQRRLLAVTIEGIRIINVYVPNGESIISPKYSYKLSWLDALQHYLVQQLKQYSRMIILGDFNIAPADQDVHDPQAWRGKVLCSEPERRIFSQLLGLGFKDTFRCFEQASELYSWWDYRAVAYRRNAGLRIDHILASTELASLCKACAVDKTPRGWEKPSDHAPVMAEFQVPIL